MPYVPIQGPGEAAREEGKEAAVSEQQLRVGSQGRRKLDGSLSGGICFQMLETQCQVSLTGPVPVAGAGCLC